MKRLVLGFCLAVGGATAAAGDLDQLLQDIKDTQSRESRADRERTARFLADRNQQQKLLAETRAALAKAEAEGKALRAEFSANEARLAGLRADLKRQSGELGDVFGKLREFAGTLAADLESSQVSAQFPGRAALLRALAADPALPGIPQLENLWFGVLQEMAESGRVARFHGKVTAAAGGQREADIVRIGTFSALADGKYLRYLPGTGQFEELPRQPDPEYLALAKDLAESSKPLAMAAIDPTRGEVLDRALKEPATMTWLPKNLRGLIANGVDFGIIGILLLGSIWAFAVAFERWMYFRRVDIGGYPSRDALETDLSRHLTVIGSVAANAPYIGLLGTVLGIMLTFQKMGLEKKMDVHTVMIGLSMALKATAVGLLVAIPCVVIHNVLRRRIREMATAYEVKHGS
jgi:biopolymer transport protein ExbB